MVTQLPKSRIPTPLVRSPFLLKNGLLCGLMMWLFLLFGGGTAHALCATPGEAGNWKNIDSQTRGVTWINIDFTCQDQILNGQPYPPGPPYHVHVFGSCSPKDCDWKRAEATRTSNGWIRAVYNQSFAIKYVYTRILADGRLYVTVYTNFTDNSGRDNYWSTGYFTKHTDSEVGYWNNVDSNTRGITRAIINQVGPNFTMSLYGKCHPTDCIWGEENGARLSSGWVHGFYDQGFATRRVYSRMSTTQPGQLLMYIYTEYKDNSGRTNGWSVYHFNK